MLKYFNVSVLLILASTFCQAEEEDLILENAGTGSGKGVIIELEENNKEEDSLEDLSQAAEEKRNPKKRRIELIVGGQGEDGVAKRGNLIINNK